MSKDIAVRPSYLPAKAKGSALADEFLAGVSSGGMPLPTLSVRGKEFRLRMGGEEANTRERELDVILVAARPHVSKRYYAQEYEGGETVAPSCHSVDGITPDADVDEPVSAKCATCPYNVWGSGNRGKGKKCSDYKRLVVLPIIKDQVMSDPAVLDVSPTAMKAPKGHRGPELFLREYFNALQRHDLPPQAAVTRLAFTDAEYPQLHFAFSRHATEAEYAHAMDSRDREEVTQVLETPALEEDGPIREAREEPAPTPAPKAVAEPKAKPQPAPEPEPEEAEVYEDNEAFDVPEDSDDTVSEDEKADVLSAIQSLLGGGK